MVIDFPHILQGYFTGIILVLGSINWLKAEWFIYASVNYENVGSDNGLSPDQHQVIIWTDAGIMLIGPLKINLMSK